MIVAQVMGIPIEESVLQLAPAGAAIVTAVAIAARSTFERAPRLRRGAPPEARVLAKGRRKVPETTRCDHLLETTRGGAMASRNVETHRSGHEAFNRRDFGAMVSAYAERISWIDRARGITFTTPQEFENDFLQGWIEASSDCRVTDARYTDAGDLVLARFTARGTNDGPLGPFPATGKEWALPICEMWQFDGDGRVVGGEIYYDQVSLLTQLELLPEPSRA
jgi:ketosteroid isomerase-like protein